MKTFVPRVWMSVMVVAGVTALLIAGALRESPAREAVDNTRNAATKPVEQAPVRRLTPDLAATFVQNEYPGEFVNSDRLIELFKANCKLLELGQPYDATIDGLTANNVLTVPQAIYILNMSIYSTCPDRL